MENYKLALERLKKKSNITADFRDLSGLESNKHMLENAVNCDTVFVLGANFGEEREIGAHRYILISRSPVFARIFARGKRGVLEGDEIFEDEREPIGEIRGPQGGGLAGKEYQHATFVLPDIQPDAFMELLRFLYYEQVTLDDTSAIAIFYAASKFKISELQERCSIYIRENIKVNTDNVYEMLDKGSIYKCHYFSEQCIDFIEEHPELSLSDELKNLTKPAVYGAMLYMDEGELAEQRAAVAAAAEQSKKRQESSNETDGI